MVVLPVMLLVITIGSECFAAYNYNAPAVNRGKIGCGTCPAVYYPKDKDKHVCSGNTVARPTTRTSSYKQKLPSALPPKSVVKAVCSNCGDYGCSGSCTKSGFSLFKLNTWISIRKAPYYPSQRRMIYYNNVYSGRQIKYLGGNWGWRGSGRRRSRSNRNWRTGYGGYVR